MKISTNLYCNQKTPFSKEFLQNQEDPVHFRFYRKLRSLLFSHAQWMSLPRVVVGLSGGADSCVLLHALVCFFHREGGPQILACHVHHGIRGALADRDLEMAQHQAFLHQVPFEAIKLDVGMKASEETLRNARLNALKKHAQAQGAPVVALGQHMHDQAETLLFRLFRGTDLKGLCGIRFERDGFWIRPLIEVEKVAIVQEAQHRNLPYIKDETNDDWSFARNFIRHHMIPEIQTQFNPNIINNLSELSVSLSHIDAYLDRQVDEVWPMLLDEEGHIKRLGLLACDPVLRKRIYQKVYQQLVGMDRVLSKKHIDAIETVIQKSEKQKLSLPENVGVVCDKDVLMLIKES
ncbi:MAG: tRNA lysidine(34) synthetase TilS [Bdellovibrionales bacterium]|nr:tRNA lysidine(34) synthetase TilS [Bdellovibrionales bacterium]